jgi:3-hydroxyacyl-CoA dehydrogenase
MDLREAKEFLNGKGYHLIDEATSKAVQEKVDWATTILDDFADITELTDEQYNEMKKLNPSLIKGWIGTKKAREFFDYGEANTIADACRVWEKLNDKKQREIERYNREKRKFEEILLTMLFYNKIHI